MHESLYDFCLRADRKNLLDQWDRAGNLPLTPDGISYGSKQKIWWQCENGHRWQAAVCARTGSGSSCPVCTGKLPLPGETDLGTLYPELARQWHPTLNGALTPEQVTPGSHRRVWWACGEGHVWKAAVYSRTGAQKNSCPVCAGHVARKQPGHFPPRDEDIRRRNGAVEILTHAPP